MDDIGLENHAETRGKQDVSEKLTPNPTLPESVELQMIIKAWPMLDAETKAVILKLIDDA
ncbi:hypothetical protein N9L06_05265 [Mariniblastus sp.]|nr:hypothetical protein [Mariniblastus sp.]